jgi:hypothetical protein
MFRKLGQVVASSAVAGGIFGGLSALGTGMGSSIHCSGTAFKYVADHCIDYGCRMIPYCSPSGNIPGFKPYPDCLVQSYAHDQFCGPYGWDTRNLLQKDADAAESTCYAGFQVGYNFVTPIVIASVFTLGVVLSTIAIRCEKRSELSENLLNQEPALAPGTDVEKQPAPAKKSGWCGFFRSGSQNDNQQVAAEPGCLSRLRTRLG